MRKWVIQLNGFKVKQKRFLKVKVCSTLSDEVNIIFLDESKITFFKSGRRRKVKEAIF